MCIINLFVHNNVRFKKKLYYKYISNGLYIHFETVAPPRKWFWFDPAPYLVSYNEKRIYLFGVCIRVWLRY